MTSKQTANRPMLPREVMLGGCSKSCVETTTTHPSTTNPSSAAMHTKETLDKAKSSLSSNNIPTELNRQEYKEASEAHVAEMFDDTRIASARQVATIRKPEAPTFTSKKAIANGGTHLEPPGTVASVTGTGPSAAIPEADTTTASGTSSCTFPQKNTSTIAPVATISPERVPQLIMMDNSLSSSATAPKAILKLVLKENSLPQPQSSAFPGTPIKQVIKLSLTQPTTMPNRGVPQSQSSAFPPTIKKVLKLSVKKPIVAADSGPSIIASTPKKSTKTVPKKRKRHDEETAHEEQAEDREERPCVRKKKSSKSPKKDGNHPKEEKPRVKKIRILGPYAQK